MANEPESPGKNRPSPPTDVKIGGKAASPDMITKAMNHITVSAKIDDPNAGQPVRLLMQYSENNFKTHETLRSDWGPQARREELTIRNLKVNHLYKIRMWTVAKPGQTSKAYTSESFWTNRKPVVELVTPAENSEYGELQMILFDWKFIDRDDPEETHQGAYSIRYRTATGEWRYLPHEADHVQGGKPGKNTYRQYPAVYLTANTTYYWSVRARDPQGIWSDWPLARSFYVRGASSPPVLRYPIGGYGTTRVVDEEIQFAWKFKDPDPKNTQAQADLRFRVKGSQDENDPEGWVNLRGEGVTPGKAMQWDIPGGYFSPGFQYEWQVRTYDFLNKQGNGLPSGWSQSGYFWATFAPGFALTDPPLMEDTSPQGALGCGHHRVFVYDRGGRILRGEIKPLARVQWGRKRDDIANCLIDTNGFDQDCGVLLGNLQSWVHELVIYRDGVRVFEGPITRITYTSESVEVEAKDVMAYLYRRVMRQGYNDAYRRIDLTPKTPPKPIGTPGGGPYTILEQNTVVDRALQITLNALAYHDPNVLPYVTAIRYSHDAEESRIVPDYSKTAWEEIDDLAATAGLDYTTVGRRIIYWDTHRSIGRLPEMRDGDFSDPVIVTEYGMQTSNWYAVTNNSGVAGVAYPHGLDQSNWFTGKPVPGAAPGFQNNYGPVEMVSSAYGEQQAAVVSTAALTPAQRDSLVTKLAKQATRGIASRWPTPVVVRVPDNSTINPQVNLGINQLVPGVWIPLRATLTCRKLSQWQKLDSLDVEEVGGQEFVRVTMSPAPHGGNDDPDLSGQEEAV